MFWKAINAGDKVDSALKDMAVVMKQVNRAEEAIEAIKSFRTLCSKQSQESLDNVLIDLYKVLHSVLSIHYLNIYSSSAHQNVSASTLFGVQSPNKQIIPSFH